MKVQKEGNDNRNRKRKRGKVDFSSKLVKYDKMKMRVEKIMNEGKKGRKETTFSQRVKVNHG